MKGKIIHVRTYFNEVEMVEMYVVEVEFESKPPFKLGEVDLKQK